MVKQEKKAKMFYMSILTFSFDFFVICLRIRLRKKIEKDLDCFCYFINTFCIIFYQYLRYMGNFSL